MTSVTATPKFTYKAANGFTYYSDSTTSTSFNGTLYKILGDIGDDAGSPVATSVTTTSGGASADLSTGIIWMPTSTTAITWLDTSDDSTGTVNIASFTPSIPNIAANLCRIAALDGNLLVRPTQNSAYIVNLADNTTKELSYLVDGTVNKSPLGLSKRSDGNYVGSAIKSDGNLLTVEFNNFTESTTPLELTPYVSDVGNNLFTVAPSLNIIMSKGSLGLNAVNLDTMEQVAITITPYGSNDAWGFSLLPDTTAFNGAFGTTTVRATGIKVTP